MREIVELSSLDLRYEGHRLRDDAREARLLASIAERGIEEPLQGVDTPAARFLLDGFKRCRCGQEAGNRLRALRVAGRGGSRGHPESDAGFDGQGPGHSGAGPIRRRSRDDPRHERGGDRRDALPQQGLGLDAAASVGRDEPGDPGDPLPRGVPRVLLHVHLAAVHAHERGPPARDRAVRGGRGRSALERAGHRVAGPCLLPRPGFAARGDRGRQAWVGRSTS